MATLQDYLQNTPAIRDPKKEALAASLAGYQTNRDVLAALGAGDTMKASSPGLGSKILGAFGVPGNLIRAGLLEATGQAPEQLRNVSGLTELAGLLSGNIRVGFGDTPLLKTSKGEGLVPRVAKMGAAFVGDVATDPLSYLGAPGSLSRLQRATALQRSAAKIIPELKKSEQGVAGIAKLVQEAPTTAVDNIRIKYGDEVAAKPEELITKLSEDELGNKLSEALLQRGSAGAIKELETLVGSRPEALRLWNMFDDEIKGGLFLTTLLGKPVTRLTSGTGAGLGKVGELANAARFAGSAIGLGQGVSKIFGGVAGQTYAKVKGGLAAETKAVAKGEAPSPFRQRFVDYVTVKDALRRRTQDDIQLTGRATAVATNVVHQQRQYAEGTPERALYDKYYKDSFFGKPLDPANIDNPAAIAGAEAGRVLANDIDYMHNVAEENGIKIATLGDPTNPERRWSPVIPEPESIAKIRKREGVRMSDAEYSTMYGRRAYFIRQSDPELARKLGYPLNPENPTVIALDAEEINALRLKEGEDSIVNITDPARIHQTYAQDLNNRIANKRFLDALEATGTTVRDVPEVVSSIDTLLASLLVSATAKLVGKPGEGGRLGELGTKMADDAVKQLDELVSPKPLRALKDRMAAARVAAANAVEASRVNERNAIQALDAATDKVDAARPNIPQYRADLKRFGDAYTTTTAEKAATEKVARSVRAKMARAQSKIDDLSEWGPWFLTEAATAARLGDEQLQAAYMAQYQIYLDKGMEGIQRSAQITRSLDDAERELAAARAAAKNLTEETIAGQRQALADFENALIEQQNAVRTLEDVRAARREAVSKFQSVRSEFAVERIRSVKTVARKYQQAYSAKAEFDAATKSTIGSLKRQAKLAGLSKEEAEAVVKNFVNQRADEAARLNLDGNVEATLQLLKDLKKVIPGTKGKASQFRAEVDTYIDSLISMSRKLTDQQFEASMMLQSEELLQDFVEKLGPNLAAGRKDREIMQQLGDLYATFKSVRPILKKELSVDERKALLSAEEREFLGNTYFAGVKGRLIKEDVRTSRTGRELQDAGLEKVGINTATKDLYAASGIKELMEHIYKTEVDSTGWEKWVNNILDPLLSVWKQTVTIGRGPGYVATNVIGGLFMNYLGNVSAADMKIAFSVVKNLESKLTALQKASPDTPFFQQLDEALTELGPEWRSMKIGDTNLETLFKEFVARGAFFSTETGFAATQIAKMGALTPTASLGRGAGQAIQFKEEAGSKLEERYRAAINFATTNRYQSFMTNMSQSSEIFLRFAPFIDGYRRYGNFESAMDKVHMLQYDYRDLSDAEQWLRRLLPFYTWTRNNVPAQLRAIALQPGKIQRAMYANEEFKNAFGVGEDDSWLNQVLPEYVQNANGFASNWTFGDNNIGFYLKLPFEDINNLFQVGEKGVPTIRGKALTNMLGPFIKAPIEMATGLNLSTGAPALPGGEKVPGYYNIFRPLGLVSTGAEGETRANAALARGIGDILPFLGTAERAASGIAALIPGEQPNILFSENQQAAGLSNLLNLTGIAPAFGLGAATLSTGSLGGEVRRRTDIQTADIKTLAGRADLDVDWIREQLRNGYTPEQIAVMIKAGQGKLGDQASTLTPATKQRYLQRLGELNSPPSA